MTKPQRDNAARWRRFAVLGQIKYGQAALRAMSKDAKCPPAIRLEATELLHKTENLMTKYKETLK